MLQRKTRLSIVCGFAMIVGLLGTAHAGVYWVEFKDKNNNQCSITNPSAFLSNRSIQRRTRLSIALSEQDLPVTTQYIQAVKAYQCSVYAEVKWLNGILIRHIDTAKIDSIKKLTFVKTVRKLIARDSMEYRGTGIYKDKFADEGFQPLDFKTACELYGAQTAVDKYKYGYATKQISLFQGQKLHNLGFDGAGIQIAVMDAGFLNADTISAFDSLRKNNQIIGTKNFVTPSKSIYKCQSHGTSVLSTMGAYVPDSLVGTAPKASYLLLVTEADSSETLVEEYLWASSAAYADSIGVDVITSSLGYTRFDDSLDQGHTWMDLDGKTAPITQAAEIAVTKGIIVVNSAGNSGAVPWKYVGCPADGPWVISVGAIDTGKVLASFSSVGPTYDNRIKPDVVAVGKGTVVIRPTGAIALANGTSFSGPQIAGMAACLRQGLPQASVKEIMLRIRNYASNAKNANVSIGYGIPQFLKSYDTLSTKIQTVSGSNKATNGGIRTVTYSSAHAGTLTLKLEQSVSGTAKIAVYTLKGVQLYSGSVQCKGSKNVLAVSGVPLIPYGSYIISVGVGMNQIQKRVSILGQ